MDAGKIVLLIIGLTTAIYAVVGLLRGEIWCKGGPYSRTSEPLRFWSSVAVYLGWTAMMIYFAFFGKTGGHP
jgi:hypothetical protein